MTTRTTTSPAAVVQAGFEAFGTAVTAFWAAYRPAGRALRARARPRSSLSRGGCRR
jgi:hypothetical protein